MSDVTCPDCGEPMTAHAYEETDDTLYFICPLTDGSDVSG